MDCKTGTLIDLSTSSESGQEFNIVSASSSPGELSFLGETPWDLGLKKEFKTGVDKPARTSPPCGVLIDLEFGELPPDNGSVPAVTLMQARQDSRFAKQNISGSIHEKSSAGSLHLKNKKCNTNANSCENVDFSWNPSVICKDVDLLENEEFSFTFELNSLDRENACQSENVSQKKPPELSTPQKMSLLADAFTSQISEEAAKVVTYLSAKKPFLKKLEVDSENILSLPNSSFTRTEINDLGPENQNSLLGNVFGYNSSKNDAVDDFLWADEHNSAYDEECVGNELCSTIMEAAVKSPTMAYDSSANITASVKSPNMAYDSSANITAAVHFENPVDNENKENIPLSAAQISMSTETTNVNLLSDILITEERELLNSSCQSKKCSPLVRTETFTVKQTPSQESKSAARNKTSSGDEKSKMQFATPKSKLHKIRQSLSFNSCRSFSSYSKKVDLPHSTLTRKETYTIGTGSNFKNLIVIGDKTSSGGSCNTPNAADRIASSAGKMKSLSCKVTKSKCETPTACSIVSSSKSPKCNTASTFKTPKMSKRSLLPSKLSYSQSFGIFQSKNKASNTSVQQSSQNKSSSFQASSSSCPSLVGSANKVPLQGDKRISAGKITDSRLGKRSMPLKAITSLGNLVKSPSIEISGGDMANVSGNKGKTPSLAYKGVTPSRSGRSNAVRTSEPTKCLKSYGTPKRVPTQTKSPARVSHIRLQL